jgi:uncharacterized protein YkwD
MDPFLIDDGAEMNDLIDAAGTETYDPPPPVSPTAQTRAAAFAQYLNMHRNSLSLAPLQEYEILRRVGQAYVNSFTTPFLWEGQQLQGFFGHNSPDGGGYSGRFLGAGITLPYGGENIAWVGMGGSEDGVLAVYLSSTTHKKNIEKAVYTMHGIGYALGTAGTYLDTRPIQLGQPPVLMTINSPGYFHINLFWGPAA